MRLEKKDFRWYSFFDCPHPFVRQGEFFIFDESGKELNHIFLPEGDVEKIQGNPNSTYTFKGDKYYYLVENSNDEVWELHTAKI